jgi:hypothetical protein
MARIRQIQRQDKFVNLAPRPEARHLSLKITHESRAIDRALAASRDGLPQRGLSTTRPGTLLGHQVAIKMFVDWTHTKPRFVEVDLVAQCGWTGAGPFLYTLTLVDVADGWVSCTGLRDKRGRPAGQYRLAGPLGRLRPSHQRRLFGTVC